jgi:hypothetical protein
MVKKVDKRPGPDQVDKRPEPDRIEDVRTVSRKTDIKAHFLLYGKKQAQDVYRIPTKYLYFNIENGRYADKMIQLKADYPTVHIDPREKEWKQRIFEMLKGEYAGTGTDKEPFERLREDIKAREQLKPGVVLQGGGVLDGNRRLAVLLDLEATEPNSERYAYLEAVILPADVPPAERWRIEAGIQLGKDEQHSYSGMNRLLKIRQGLELFKKEKLPPGKRPEQVISDTLFGVEPSEVRQDIQIIELIDAYLLFIGQRGAYQLIGERIERFTEAVKILNIARDKNWPPQQVLKLKTALFAHIRDMTMDNWELRKVAQAMGPRKKPLNERAMAEFTKIAENPEKVRQALSKPGPRSPLAATSEQQARDFLDFMQAEDAKDQPLRLARIAKNNLDLLAETLGSVSKHDGWETKIEELPMLLRDVMTAAKRCADNIARLRGGKVRRPRVRLNK